MTKQIDAVKRLAEVRARWVPGQAFTPDRETCIAAVEDLGFLLALIAGDGLTFGCVCGQTFPTMEQVLGHEGCRADMKYAPGKPPE